MTRLRRSNTNGRGYHRVPAGRGFGYRDSAGRPVRDGRVLDRLKQLVIPPAWTQVWISPHANGHILATGIDAAGRRQYIYHPSWRARMDRQKFDRALALAEALPSARRAVTLDLRRSHPDRLRVLAAAFRMLDQGSLRVGSERYVIERGSRGLSTLLCSHVSVSGDDIRLDFPGKSRKRWSSTIHDHDLTILIAELQSRGPSARLLAYEDAGQWHPLAADDVNDYVGERTRGDFTAKDFRTLRGTAAAALDLARTGPLPTRPKRKRAVTHAVVAASRVLGNSPSIARTSYVDPRLIDAYERGETVDPARPHSVEAELRALLSRR